MEISIPQGSIARLKRVMELRKCTESEALDYCISMGWFAAEKKADVTERKIIPFKDIVTEND